ncbi:MAG: hypothetical protein DBY15_01865 [Clostridiales bacterium]|jgi:hypothetical protein|nr:MAG: hypothetical protein DBY15_01865 [Clostridiales bacterium]
MSNIVYVKNYFIYIILWEDYIMEQDIQVLRQRMAELVKNENLKYDDIYKMKLEMDDIIDKYYFEQI